MKTIQDVQMATRRLSSGVYVLLERNRIMIPELSDSIDAKN
ncbi:MAG: hypothetical protein OQK67_05710 [Chlorobium sp.]|nr:hypothetical protein [Chlorobium sp.]